MQARRSPTLARCLLALACLALASCSTLPRTPLPAESEDLARLPGMPTVRASGGTLSPTMARDLELSFDQESDEQFPVGPDGTIDYAHLALSGGGPHGAFGAGLLNGWTKAGTRPVFKIVTGVSTGALMAPFAFLGADYDDELREFYTTTTSARIFTRLRLLPQIFQGESLADSSPMRKTIAEAVDAALLSEIAKAHLSGRRLYIATANLDSQRFVVWNMGLIATSNRPGALDLFRKVMQASASIPVAFPPVLFDVEANGRRYDEMHVDGAVGASVFYSGGVFDFDASQKAAGRGPGHEDIFIIHNGQLASVNQPTRRTLGSIAMRSIDSAGKAAVVGDLFRIYTVATRSGSGYHWVTMPGDISLQGDTLFDPVLMGRLFDLGYAKGVSNPIWSTVPPGLTP